MLDARFSHLYFYQSLNRLQLGLSAIAELLVLVLLQLCGALNDARYNRDHALHAALRKSAGQPLIVWIYQRRAELRH